MAVIAGSALSLYSALIGWHTCPGRGGGLFCAGLADRITANKDIKMFVALCTTHTPEFTWICHSGVSMSLKRPPARDKDRQTGFKQWRQVCHATERMSRVYLVYRSGTGVGCGGRTHTFCIFVSLCIFNEVHVGTPELGFRYSHVRILLFPILPA